MAKAVKWLCEMRSGLDDEEEPEELRRQTSIPVSWLAKRASSLSIGFTTSMAAVSELIASQAGLGQSMVVMAEGIHR